MSTCASPRKVDTDPCLRHVTGTGGKSNTGTAASSPSFPFPTPQGPPNDPTGARLVLPAAAPPTQASAALKGQLSMTRSTIFCSSLLGGQGIPPRVAGSQTRGCRLSPTRCCSRRLYCSGGDGGGAGSPGAEGGGAAMMGSQTLGAASGPARAAAAGAHGNCSSAAERSRLRTATL